VKKEELLEASVKTSLGVFSLFVGLLFPLVTLCVLIIESLPAIGKFGIVDFLMGTTWDPVAEIFSALPALTGTLLVTFLASAIALPVSVAWSCWVPSQA